MLFGFKKASVLNRNGCISGKQAQKSRIILLKFAGVWVKNIQHADNLLALLEGNTQSPPYLFVSKVSCPPRPVAIVRDDHGFAGLDHVPGHALVHFKGDPKVAKGPVMG